MNEGAPKRGSLLVYRHRKRGENFLFSPCTCAPFYLAIDRAGPARSTPFLCSRAKKRGGAPKKRAFGCRHGRCSVPPASPTNSKPQHHSRLRQADLSARSTHQAPAQSRAKMSNDNRGSSAHANGGASGVKRRFSLAARHRFFGQAPKKWGRIAGRGSDYLPKYRRTRTKRRKEKGGTPGEGSPLDPLLRSNKHKRVPRSAERGQGLCPCTLPPLKRRAKLSFALRAGV